MAQVAFRNLVKQFGGITAVRDLNLEIADREFLVLVGPSGCGKTTALRCLAGLEDVTSGDLVIGDRLVNQLEPKDRDIAMVFQSYALYPHMSVYENMAFGLRMRLPPTTPLARWLRRREWLAKHADIDRRVRAVAELLNLGELLHRRPKELSGGQRQRVALGRAIVREPQVFLMDEPLSNLDARLRVATRAELIKLHRRLGITTIYVTHDQVEAMTMGDRIAVMDGGVLQQCDTPLNLYNHPANRFVAGFIGSPEMNILEATLRHDREGLCVETVGIQLVLPSDRQQAASPFVGKPVLFGIRPEHIYDASLNARTQSRPVLEAQVDLAEPLGSSILFTLTLGGHNLLASFDSTTQARQGQPWPVAFDLTKAHLFDAETERAVW